MGETEFRGKGALVTGGGRGIGRAVARLFSERGGRVALHYRANRGEAERTFASLAEEGHLLVQGDVGEAEEARRIVEEAARGLGGLDVLVNNAGVFEEHRIDEADWEEWRRAWERTVAVNLMGPAHLCFWAARRMMEKGGGRIVNVSSRGAFRGEPFAPAYGASKAGLNALTGSLAKALAPRGVFVACVAPGFVETDMAEPFLHGPEGDAVRAQSPLGRPASPEEIAELILFLASGRCDFATGAVVDANGASYLR
ncbi:MAG: SDR family oxidoreductase [Candidatus Eisenbacteria bacterium]|nr:SDR family oxidoreductase [Candidatus Eisenbacteria bacterium]